MDTVKGEVSFVLNGVSLGVAYEGIPLDQPLVPCVILYNKGDSVELDTSEVRETAVDSSIPVPSNIITKSGITWDSITLTWDAVEGASFYQVMVEGSKRWGGTVKTRHTTYGLEPATPYFFRVRSARKGAVSEWSTPIREFTKKIYSDEYAWKECPDNVCGSRRYFVSETNPRIAENHDCAQLGGNSSTVVGNRPFPPFPAG